MTRSTIQPANFGRFQRCEAIYSMMGIQPTDENQRGSTSFPLKIKDNMRNSNTAKSINSNGNTAWAHPDSTWLLEINGFPLCGEGWKLTGTLTFRQRFLAIQNDLVKDLFSELNFYMNGEHDWKNVPVYWRWEYDETERMNVHFVLMDATPEFHWLRGSENSFSSSEDLVQWLNNNWKHGKSEYADYLDNSWLQHLLRIGTIHNTCFSPPIHYLKTQIRDKQVCEALGKLVGTEVAV